jgi:hypothetical protein
MPLRKKPVRSPRALYKVDLITRHLDDNKDAIDTAPAQTVQGTKLAIVVKMKEAIGNFLGLTPVAWNDPIFTGTFPNAGGNPPAGGAQTGTTNSGSRYRKNLGGFREASYTLIAKTKFVIPEIVLGENGYSVVNSEYVSVSIGFPKGHSVTEVLNFLFTTSVFNQIRAIRTPEGKLINVTNSSLAVAVNP